MADDPVKLNGLRDAVLRGMNEGAAQLPSAHGQLLIGLCRIYMAEMTDSERLSFLQDLTEGYCVECGRCEDDCRCAPSWDE